MRALLSDIAAGLLSGWHTYRTRRYWRRRGVVFNELPF